MTYAAVTVAMGGYMSDDDMKAASDSLQLLPELIIPKWERQEWLQDALSMADDLGMADLETVYDGRLIKFAVAPSTQIILFSIEPVAVSKGMAEPEPTIDPPRANGSGVSRVEKALEHEYDCGHLHGLYNLALSVGATPQGAITSVWDNMRYDNPSADFGVGYTEQVLKDCAVIEPDPTVAPSEIVAVGLGVSRAEVEQPYEEQGYVFEYETNLRGELQTYAQAPDAKNFVLLIGPDENLIRVVVSGDVIDDAVETGLVHLVIINAVMPNPSGAVKWLEGALESLQDEVDGERVRIMDGRRLLLTSTASLTGSISLTIEPFE